MTTTTATKGFQLATAAAALAFSAFAIAATAPAGSSGKAVAAGDAVHCYGVNSGKGYRSCNTRPCTPVQHRWSEIHSGCTRSASCASASR